jgi:nucleoside-diphosphate-sugar epimerase
LAGDLHLFVVMRIVVTGATGNVGTSVLNSLAFDPRVDEVVGVARRRPELSIPKCRFVEADVARHELDTIFMGYDAVIHLAWLIQPSHKKRLLQRVNVEGSRRVFETVVRTRVPALIYASSVGAYSPGPKDRAVDESWPTRGIASSLYSRQKAEVERMLDTLEREQPRLRVVRMRPALIFKRGAASEIKRLFLGPLVPRFLLRHGPPLIPDLVKLRFQALHSLDAGDAYRLATLSDARGAFNLAADPVLDSERIATLFNSRRVRMPADLLRALVAVGHRLHLVPVEAGWLDMALNSPLLDSSRARRELGWQPRHLATHALLELFEGMVEKSDMPTPPLRSRTATG